MLARFSPEVLEYVAQDSCEGAFLTQLASHTGATIEEASGVFNQLGPTLRWLVQSPSGWAILSHAMMPPGCNPLMPSVH